MAVHDIHIPHVFDRTDGSKGASYEVNASQVIFLSPQDDTPGEGGTNEQFLIEVEISF